jgi:hypothetical protein
MLRKVTFAAMVSLMGTPMQAQEKHSLACQYVRSGGLMWENNNWVPTGFVLDQPFFLSVENNELPASSAGSVFGGPPAYQETVSCISSLARFTTCVGKLGDTLFLNHETNSGAVSSLYGGGMTGDERDTLTIKTFICQRM